MQNVRKGETMEVVQMILGIILSWIFLAYLLGGLILWYFLMLILAQMFYKGDGLRTANTAAWMSFLLLLCSAFLVSYYLRDDWVEIGVLTLAGILIPLIAAIWFTTIE